MINLKVIKEIELNKKIHNLFSIFILIKLVAKLETKS